MYESTCICIILSLLLRYSPSIWYLIFGTGKVKMYLDEVYPIGYWLLAIGNASCVRRMCVLPHRGNSISLQYSTPHRWYTLVLPLNVLMSELMLLPVSSNEQVYYAQNLLPPFLSCSIFPVLFQHARLNRPGFARYSERPMPSLSLPRPPRPRPPSLCVYRTTLLSTTTPISTTNKKTSNT